MSVGIRDLVELGLLDVVFGDRSVAAAGSTWWSMLTDAFSFAVLGVKTMCSKFGLSYSDVGVYGADEFNNINNNIFLYQTN